MEGNVCEWITLAAPTNIHDPGSSTSQPWRAVAQSLSNLTKATGVQKCTWSCVLERPSLLYIWIVWTYQSAYKAQLGNGEHRSLYEKLALLSTLPVNTKVIQYYMPGNCTQAGWWDICWPIIILIRFAGLLTKEQRHQVENIESMTGRTGYYNQGMDEEPIRGFVLDDTENCDERGDLIHDTYAMLDCWLQPIREEEVKSIGKEDQNKISASGRLDRAQSPPPCFVNEINALSCANIETQHLWFTTVFPPSDFFGEEELDPEDIEARSFEFYWKKGRKIWELEKKGRMRMGYSPLQLLNIGEIDVESECELCVEINPEIEPEPEQLRWPVVG
ncbi:hypothetical protein BKA58DRAFT_436152 [Alternaria rosae]|uniref:uncharacterized protein n=1 Tax=Alternaria rosae TaxID=1187941 RepID=UPI001E8D0EC2|nr:uncharacterized protein BKA58DRAFT_436152 [Alternaria rosae]KAH6878451.1 hypothetical protein BKA58DRAFT_436152 [Alternaria rosae]